MKQYKRADIGVCLLTLCFVVTISAESRADQPGKVPPAEAETTAEPAAQDADIGGKPAEPGGNLNIDPEQLGWHVPDLELNRQRVADEMERARREGDENAVTLLTRVLQRVDTLSRPERIHLTLEEAVLQALANAYDIRTQSFNPAVETTRIVEAEAAFDAIFFSSVAKNKVDRPNWHPVILTSWI